MAKLEQVISGDFYEVLGKIERGIVEGSMSASLEAVSYTHLTLPTIRLV